MKRASPRRLAWAPKARRWLAQLLLVLYVAASHGLPAVHLAWHRNDHVHELGGLRWLRPHAHVHVHAHAHAADGTHPTPPPARAAAPRLLEASGAASAALALHAAGPAHGPLALHPPAALVRLLPAAPSRLGAGKNSAPPARGFLVRPHARGPPRSA